MTATFPWLRANRSDDANLVAGRVTNAQDFAPVASA